MPKKRPGKTSRPRPPSATAESRFTLLLEQIQEQNRATIEAVFASRDELRREMREIASGFGARIEQLKIETGRNTEQLKQLTEEVRKISGLERRVSALEQRSGS